MATSRKQNAEAAQSGLARRILVADDDQDVRELLSTWLAEEGFEVDTASSVDEVLAKATDRNAHLDLILLDRAFQDSDMDGLKILQHIQEEGTGAAVVIITSSTASEAVIKAMQLGARDYITKPLEHDRIMDQVRRILGVSEQDIKPYPVPKVSPEERIIGASGPMIDVFKMIGQVARTSATILITGETGTGKELIAEAIHNASDRRTGPMVKVNCPALPETLLESELFGHEKGAFTNALAQRKGRFEMANNGTILLDEMGEITASTQSKLLRVLQEHEFERVGSSTPIKVNVRVVAATNRDLLREVQDGRFREDLYYRLNVVQIHLPPLRERKDDIPSLVSHFLNKFRGSTAALPARISEDAMSMLTDYSWPGNVRELEHVIEGAVLFSRGEMILPEHIRFGEERSHHLIDVEMRLRQGHKLADLIRRTKRDAATAALSMHHGDEAQAAGQLGISVEELWKLREVSDEDTEGHGSVGKHPKHGPRD